MELKTLTPELAVAAQIHASDLREIANAGFRTVICNRPDGEGNDQPVFAELQASARGLDIALHYLPAESGKVTDEQGRQFGALMDASPKPVLAFCRTGMRSTTMWALSQSGQRPLPEIIERAANAGYDLKGVVPRLVNGGKTPVEVHGHGCHCP